MQTGSWLSLQTCPATLLLANCTVLLAKMPTHTQAGCRALDILGGLSPVPTSQSLGLNANALETCVEARGRPRHVTKRRVPLPVWAAFSPRAEGCESRLSGTLVTPSMSSPLTGHRGHCLLTQPGQEPCHLQKRVHTFGYLHMSVSNFLNKLQFQVFCHLEGFTHSKNVANDVFW